MDLSIILRLDCSKLKKGPLLIPFERFYIQSRYHHNKLVPEQNTGERNPLYQLIFDLRITTSKTKYRSARLSSNPSSAHFNTVNTLQPIGCPNCWYVL